MAGTGSVAVTVEERAPPPPPPRAGDDGRGDCDGDGDGGGGGGGGGGGVPNAAVAGGASGGVVLLVAGAICDYCRRNEARAQTQHRTRHSAGDTMNAAATHVGMQLARVEKDVVARSVRGKR